MNFCPSCGAPVKDGAKFCEQCGAPLAAAPQESRQRITVHPDIANDTIVWEGKEYTAQEWADRFGGMSADVDADDGGHATEGASVNEPAPASCDDCDPVAAQLEATRAAIAAHEAMCMFPRRQTAAAHETNMSEQPTSEDALVSIQRVFGRPSIEIAPYASPLTDKERAGGNTPAKNMPEHAKRQLKSEVSQINTKVTARAARIRKRVEAAEDESSSTARLTGYTIDDMEHDSTYYSDTVSFKDLAVVKRYRRRIERNLQNSTALVEQVTTWLDTNVPLFLADAEILATRMWETFDQSALDRAHSALREAEEARERAAQEYRTLKAACDEELRTGTREHLQHVEPDYSKPVSESLKRYASLCLGLVVLTLALSLVCWLFLHVAVIIMALPIVRMVGIVGALGFFIASVVVKKGPEQKRAAALVAKNEEIDARNRAIDTEAAALRQKQESRLAPVRNARDAAQQRAGEAQKAVRRAEQAVDSQARMRFTTFMDSFRRVLDALDSTIDPAFASLTQLPSREELRKLIDDEWMNELKKHDTARYTMLYSERKQDEQTRSQLNMERDNRAKNAQVIAEQKKQTKAAQDTHREAKRNADAAEKMQRDNSKFLEQRGEREERVARAQEKEALAGVAAKYAEADAHRAAESKDRAIEKSVNRRY